MNQPVASSARAGEQEQPSGEAPTVPDYELLRRIGGGAYGEVWLARSIATGAMRAAKIVWRHRFEDERPYQREFEGIQKFERISREHPSQLALFHIGRNEAEGYFYYVMELGDGLAVQSPRAKVQSSLTQLDVAAAGDGRTPVAGQNGYEPHTLRADLAGGPLPTGRVLEIGLALTEALGHLHRHGLVHRDVKPSNVIFVNGRPKLADIGLVTDASDQCSIVGTEGYLPPEGPGTPQADIFALGKVLYEASTGMDRRKFPDLPSDVREWPQRNAVFELNAILLKACASDTRNRYSSAGQLQADLALLRQGRSVRRQFRWRKRLVGLRRAGLAISALAAAGVVSFVTWRQLGNSYAVSDNEDVNNLVKQGFRSVESQAPDRLRQAEEDFEEALNLDHTFVPAHWGLFQVAINKMEWTWNAPPRAHQHIRALADKLTAIAPNRAESHTAAAFIRWMDWDFAAALAEDLKATRMRAACVEGRSAAYSVYGFHLMETGHPNEALAAHLKAKPLNPTSSVVLQHLGHFYFARKEFGQALRYYEDSLKVEPNHTGGHRWKARVFEETGNFLGALNQFDEADRIVGRTNSFNAILREAVQHDPTGPAHGYWNTRLDEALKGPSNGKDYYYIATLYARVGDTTNAYSFLKRACEKHAFSQGPLFDVCWDKSDTNFQAIVRSIGLCVPIQR